ncbi:MAG: hypothetical protein PHI68_04115 [Candidatus Cloacimonetes bacterium]|nr:hypothetical protein [Candidatus Cloacimonadota bacterium]
MNVLNSRSEPGMTDGLRMGNECPGFPVGAGNDEKYSSGTNGLDYT